ncbi:hypothetical protein PMIN02_007613 [Paraphaeosphaeria minitans]
MLFASLLIYPFTEMPNTQSVALNNDIVGVVKKIKRIQHTPENPFSRKLDSQTPHSIQDQDKEKAAMTSRCRWPNQDSCMYEKNRTRNGNTEWDVSKSLYAISQTSDRKQRSCAGDSGSK